MQISIWREWGLGKTGPSDLRLELEGRDVMTISETSRKIGEVTTKDEPRKKGGNQKHVESSNSLWTYAVEPWGNVEKRKFQRSRSEAESQVVPTFSGVDDENRHTIDVEVLSRLRNSFPPRGYLPERLRL